MKGRTRESLGPSKADIRGHAGRIGVGAKTVEKFLEKCLHGDGVASPFCSHAAHRLEPGSPVYLFDGTGTGMETCYCSDIDCFLNSVDPAAVSGRRARGTSKLCCSTCGRMADSPEDAAPCRRAGHAVRVVENERSAADDGPSHTDCAAAIMAERHFLTLRDTREVLHYSDGVYQTGGETIIEEETERRVEKCTRSMRAEVIDAVRVRTYVERGIFDADPNLLNLRNGVLDLEKIELQPHDHAVPFRCMINAEYEPSAAPKKFMRFLCDVLEDRQDRQTLLEMWATVLLRGTTNLEKAAMLIGGGANGKSTFLRTMIEVVGRDNIASESVHSLLWNRFAKASLDGKMANVYMDISSEELDRTGALKSLITGEPIGAEHKNKPAFVMESYAKMFFAANQLPEIDEDSNAVYRRFVIINFPKRYAGADRDPNLLTDLITEREKSGILNLLLGHARIIRRRGCLTYESTVEQVRAEWHDKADPVRQFFGTCTEGSPGAIVKTGEMYKRYVDFCSDRHYVPKSQRVFTTKGKEYGHAYEVAKVGGKAARVWRNLKLKASPEDGPPPAMPPDNESPKPAPGGGSDKSGYKYCRTCGFGPWSTEGDNGRRVTEYHTVRGCEVVDHDGGMAESDGGGHPG